MEYIYNGADLFDLADSNRHCCTIIVVMKEDE
jgi:hypothetical protein